MWVTLCRYIYQLVFTHERWLDSQVGEQHELKRLEVIDIVLEAISMHIHEEEKALKMKYNWTYCTLLCVLLSQTLTEFV